MGMTNWCQYWVDLMYLINFNIILLVVSVPDGVPVPSAVRHPRMLELSWPEPSSPNGIITRYNLTVDSVLRYSGVDQQFNVTGLQVYTQYKVQLSACTIMGCSKGAQATIYTGELPPEGLSFPTLTVLSNDSMRVGWDEPKKPNGVIRRYEIHISTTEPLGPGYKVFYNGSRSDLSATISGLVTGTLYYVRVKAFSGSLLGTFSNASSARTVSGIPNDIPAPVLTAMSPYSIHVHMLPPKKPNGVITRYELYQDDILSPVLSVTKLTNYTADGLQVYSSHTFRVKACTFKGCNPSELARGYSGELPPNGTIQLQTNVISAREVKVSWTRVQHNGNVTYYFIIKGPFIIPGSAVMATESRNERIVGEPDKEWTYNGLLPDNSYEFLVNASNSKGFILSNNRTGKTPEAGKYTSTYSCVCSSSRFSFVIIDLLYMETFYCAYNGNHWTFAVYLDSLHIISLNLTVKLYLSCV